MKKIILLLVMVMFITACSNETKAKVQKIDCINKNVLMSEGAVLIDVRSSLEYESGNLKNSINIDVDAIENVIESKVSDKNTKIILYCRSGNRSNTAANKLIDMGYKNVYDLGAMSNCSN
jgi:rhodanese-related sulfurtransferase